VVGGEGAGMTTAEIVGGVTALWRGLELMVRKANSRVAENNSAIQKPRNINCMRIP
jgi:hypothetical protein